MQLSQWMRDDAEDSGPMRIHKWADEVAQLEQRVEELEEALGSIRQWSDAYPLDIFPEPDFKKAQEILKAGGMTLDGISASNMRHVVEGVGEIAKSVLREDSPNDR